MGGQRDQGASGGLQQASVFNGSSSQTGKLQCANRVGLFETPGTGRGIDPIESYSVRLDVSDFDSCVVGAISEPQAVIGILLQRRI